MKMSIAALVAYLWAQNYIQPIINNPLTQFGTNEKRYLGATLLPEITKTRNEYREDKIRLRSIPAKHSTRYSAVQKNDGAIIASMLVTLGNSDIGTEFTSQDYDALVDYLEMTSAEGIPPMEAVTMLINWMDTTIIIPLAERNEIDRWRALLDGIITVRGDNGYSEDIPVIAPTGHRVVTAGNWDDPDYDIYGEITGRVAFLSNKGYKVNRLITGGSVIYKMRRNNSFKNLTGSFAVQGASITGQRPGLVDLDGLNEQLSRDKLPPIEQYDDTYEVDGDGPNVPFFRRDAFFGACTTGRTATIPVPNDTPIILPDTLGYVGVGRAAGQSGPGRVAIMTPYENKPPRIEFEGWQASGVVVQDVEAEFAILGC